MNRKLFITVLMVAVFVMASVAMAKTENGQKKYDEGLYREALALFENDYAATRSEESFVKMIQTRLMLKEFEAALKTALKPPQFKDKQWQLLHQIVYGKSIERFVNSYSTQMARTEIEGATEPIQRTQSQWLGDLKKIALGLSEESKFLLELELENVKPFFFFKDVDVEALPTVYDWLVSEILNNPQWGSPGMDDRIKLMEKAIAGRGKKRAYVIDFWEMQRMLARVPQNAYYYFDPNIKDEPIQTEEVRKQASEMESVFGKMDTSRGQAEWLMQISKFYIRNRDIARGRAKCQEAIAIYKGPSVSECLQMISQMENKEISISQNRFHSKSEIKVPIVTRNLSTIYVRVFASPNKTIDENMAEVKGTGRRVLGEDELKTRLKQKPLQIKKHVMSPKNIYLNFESEIDLGVLEPGLYTVVVSDSEQIEDGKTFVYTSELRVTDIQMIYQLAASMDPEKSLGEMGAKTIPSHYFYVFDSGSGRLLNDVPLKAQIQSKSYVLKTNADGVVVLDDVWNFQGSQNQTETYSDVTAVAQVGYSVSTYRNQYVSKPTFQHLKFMIEFDRPIYRPGQKIHMKATVLRRVPFGYQVLKNSPVKIKVMNSQYETVVEKNMDTNAQGAVSWVYDLPLNGLLGSYTFQVEALPPSTHGGAGSVTSYGGAYGASASESVRVEEYKRPDFFVELEKAKVPWVLDKKISFKVFAKYYYGAPVKKGRVSYSIQSQTYHPWYYGGQSVRADMGGSDVYTGEGILDDKGEFIISYVPKANGAESRRFIVKVSIFDESGRSVDGFATYLASAKDFFISALPSKDFYKNSDRPSFTVKLEDPNGALYSSLVHYELWELIPPSADEKKKMKKDEGVPVGPPGPYNRYRYEGKVEWKRYVEKLTTKSLKTGSWTVTKEKSDFNLNALAEGVYKIKFSTRDSEKRLVESELFFLVAETGKKLSTFYIPEVTLLSKPEYKIGETMTVLFGSSEYSGHAVGFLLKHQLKIDHSIFKTNHGIKIYDFKITESMFNGSSFVWFSVFDNQVATGRQLVSVNNDYKSLDIQFDTTSKMTPGQNARLKIVNKSKVDGLDAMVTMYDQSLEYYARRDRHYLQEIYQNQDWSQEGAFQYEQLSSFNLDWIHPDLKSMLDKFRKNTKYKYKPVMLIDTDRLREENDYALGFGGSGRQGRGQSIDKASRSQFAMAPMLSAKAEMAEMDSASLATGGASGQIEREKNKSGDDSGAALAVSVRKDFSETAVFEPFFLVSGGVNQLAFKAPDQLTAWKVKLLSISPTGLIGQDEQVIQSQKDFFVRVLVPRYFREGDTTEIKLKVDNVMDVKMSAQLTLELSGEGIKPAELLAAQKMKVSIEVGPNDSYVHTWKLKVPSVLVPLKIKAIAVADKATDAEEKTISILPSRQRLIESSLAYVKNKQTVLTLKNWDKTEATRVNEMMSVQIDPQLPLMLLNSVPALVNYPYSCSEQLISKYVPLAIISSMYEQNPKLKTAVQAALKKTGTRKTITLPWEESDPRRLLELTETPWLVNAKGLTSSHELISYLDAATIAKIKNEIFKDLKMRQTRSGGFSWFPGGRDDLYITLVVLEGISEAALYGVDYPKELFAKALDYVYKELPKYLKAQIDELQFLIYGTYVFTSFDSKRKNLSFNKDVASAWIPFIEKHETLITPLGHAYMAHIYKRLGDEKKSAASLTRAMEGSRKDDLIGIYWAPEERSWMWYRDTVEKHAFFLKTLIQLKPQDDRIEGLVQWLLFNKKGTQWTSTKSTTKAIFSLMHYLRLKTQFTEKTQVAMDWGGHKENFNIDPLDVDQKDSLRIIKTENFKADSGHVTITKTGALPVFAGITWVYTTDEMVGASGSSVMDLQREFLLIKPGKDSAGTRVVLSSGAKVAVGEEIEVALTIKSKSSLDYVHLKDPRGAGFESDSLLSGYQWDSISRYEEPRDSLMNFFFDSLPRGEYRMSHRFKATTPGMYKFNSATIQSMYAPQITAYSSSFQIEVVAK